jgi:hypothetical protein
VRDILQALQKQKRDADEEIDRRNAEERKKKASK